MSKLKYLRGTRDLGLVLDGREGLGVLVWADASHAVHPDAKGHNGTIVRVGKCLVSGEGNQQCTVVLYVDDLLVTCKDRGTIDATLATLKAKYKDVREHVGTKHSYLGMSMDFTKKQIVSITMSHFIDSVLVHVSVLGVAVSPATAGFVSVDESSQLQSE